MGGHNFYDGGEYTAQDPKGVNEPFVNAKVAMFNLGAPMVQKGSIRG